MQRMDNNILTKETVLLNQEINNQIYQEYISVILTTLDKYCEFPIYNKKLYLDTVPKHYNTYDPSSLNQIIYQTLAKHGVYGKIKYKLCSKRGYRKLFVTFYDPNRYSQKILKHIARYQRPNQTDFHFIMSGYSLRDAYAHYYNYKLALTPYGYRVTLEYSSYHGNYVSISLHV